MICLIIVNVRWERLAIIRAYLSIIASRYTNSRTISADMDGFQDGGYIWAQGVLQYHLIEVPCSNISNMNALLCLTIKFGQSFSDSLSVINFLRLMHGYYWHGLTWTGPSTYAGNTEIMRRWGNIYIYI